MGDFKINEKTVFTQSGSDEPAMGSTVTGIPAAGVTGVLPVGVTGGSGLTALGTVTAGNLSNTAIVYPVGHIIKTTINTSDTDLAITTATTTTAEGDATDVEVTCTVGNRLHIWIVGGMGYAATSGGYFSYGVRMTDAQGTIDKLIGTVYSRSSADYTNDTTPSVAYSMTARETTVTIKRLLRTYASITAYWAGGTGMDQITYIIMEEQR